uniref:Uncharacterized protein n=1 Tax=uncultured marine virus TaxID=186617 RepID=S4TF36_9VIRU|nr:hypothetical protein [uncultured marine virus]
MARNYKQLTNHVKDSSNSTGGWNRIAKFLKDTPNAKGTGYLDRVTVNFLVDDIDGADTLRSSFPFGHMFALSHSSATETVDGEGSQLDPADLLDVGCRDGGAGSITLYARCKIQENNTDTAEGDGVIHLWQKNTDLTDDDNVIMRYYVETYGRWVECSDV